MSLLNLVKNADLVESNGEICWLCDVQSVKFVVKTAHATPICLDCLETMFVKVSAHTRPGVVGELIQEALIAGSQQTSDFFFKDGDVYADRVEHATKKVLKGVLENDRD